MISPTVTPRDTRRFAIRPAMALVFVLAAAVFLAARPADAQLSMSLSPVRVEHAIPPGQMRTDIVTVENVSQRPLRARVTVADWFLERNGTPVFVKRGSRPGLSMSAWIEVNPTEFELEPGGAQVIRYTLSVPEDTPDASYRTAVLVESLPDFTDTPAWNVAYLTGRIGLILYNGVGTSAPAAEIVAHEVVREPGVPGEIALKLTVRNAGLVNFRLSGDSHIRTPDGHVLQVVSIPDGVVLPGSERDVWLRFDRPINHPVFSVLSRVDVGQEALLEVETQVGMVAANNGASGG